MCVKAALVFVIILLGVTVTNGQTTPAGFPPPDVTQKARDDADYQRAVTAYRFWYPTVSCEGIMSGMRDSGLRDNLDIQILACGPRHVLFTGNSDTPYGGATLDLADGPFVIELPPGPYVSLVMDHHQRWVMDMGLPGPDAGKGGKHLILPPGYKGDVPPGYNVGRSSSYKVTVAFRAIPAKGDIQGALESLRAIKVYPLASAAAGAANLKLLKFVDFSTKKIVNTSLPWEDNFTYWEKLHEVIEYEPVVDEFRPMYGMLAALGIAKGKPLVPDALMKGILERAAKAGRDQMIACTFDTQRPDRMVWNDRKWEWATLSTEGCDFETTNGIDLEARDRWFMQAIGMSPAMLRRGVGAGSVYWLGHRDGNGAFLDGGRTYTLTVPQPVPASLFWSVTVYDAQTRSQIQTDQDKAALRSLFELKHKSGSTTDLYFGPQAPAGHEVKWIKTIPGKGWFTYFRIYGPEAPAFDGTWKPGDFERID